MRTPLRSVGVLALLGALAWRMPGEQAAVCGVVVDENGAGIGNALVIASGGFRGWANVKPDGVFCIREAGPFLSVRHPGYNPLLLRTPAPGAEVRLRLAKAGANVRTMPDCRSRPNSGQGWIGEGLRIRPPGQFQGPVSGEHDTHWYVWKGKRLLHIVSGDAWHAGLPTKAILSESRSIEVHGWEFGDIAGLDLTGVSQDGSRWRWIGAPVSDAISYEGATAGEAEYFDRILESVCYAAAPR